MLPLVLLLLIAIPAVPISLFAMFDGFPLPIIVTATFLIGYPLYIWGPFAILYLRGWRTPEDVRQYQLGLHASPWKVVFRKRKAVERYLATAALMGQREPADHVYEWFGDDVLTVFRAVTGMLWRHPEIRALSGDVVTILAEEKAEDWRSVLRHFPYARDTHKAILYARIEAIAVAENIPFDYARELLR